MAMPCLGASLSSWSRERRINLSPDGNPPRLSVPKLKVISHWLYLFHLALVTHAARIVPFAML